MKNIYIIKLDKKYFKRLLNHHIYILKIKKRKDCYLLYLDKVNYLKILELKKIYEFEVVGKEGLIKLKDLLKKYYLFFIMLILSFIYLIFLSNIIFEIDIQTEDFEIKELVKNNLEKYDFKVFRFVKSFNEKEKIKKEILVNNKDKLEWMEITRNGSRYIVSLERRILNNKEEDNRPKDIVALKNAIILSIEATDGSIVKKLNDYVKKGDVIVTGKITHKDTVVDLISAKATIYGETWYNVHVSYPISYYEKIETGNTHTRFSFYFLNKKISLFDKKYTEEEIVSSKCLKNSFLPIKIGFEKVKEVRIVDDIYTIEEAAARAIIKAREKLLSSLPSDSKVLSEKKLKIIVNNSTIDVDVFFKVYENITDIKILEEEGE